MTDNDEVKKILESAKEKSAVHSIRNPPSWSLGKRWDTIDSFHKLQEKLAKMGVHSVSILIAENPIKRPTRKIKVYGQMKNLVYDTAQGREFALQALSLKPKCKEYKGS